MRLAQAFCWLGGVESSEQNRCLYYIFKQSNMRFVIPLNITFTSFTRKLASSFLILPTSLAEHDIDCTRSVQRQKQRQKTFKSSFDLPKKIWHAFSMAV